MWRVPSGAPKAVTVTRNEILTVLKKPENFLLAIVEVEGAASCGD